MNVNCVILTTTSKGEGLENYTSDNYDLFIIDYTSQKNQSPLHNNKYKFVFESEGGYKYHNIKRLLELTTILEDYEYIWLPDWDINFNPNDLNNLFSIAKEYNLDLSQPSLSEDSHISWKITQHNPNTKVRLTNFVEVMCPLFKNTFLKEVLWTLNLNYSSWGLDFLWGSLAKENKIGIVDSIVVKHDRPISSHEWLLPNNLNANQELEELKNKYNFNLSPKVFKYLI